MPPQLKKIVVDANSFYLQNLAPDLRQRLFKGVARSGKPRRILRAFMSGKVRRRQRLSVKLAVRRQRHLLHDHEKRRDHVSR